MNPDRQPLATLWRKPFVDALKRASSFLRAHGLDRGNVSLDARLSVAVSPGEVRVVAEHVPSGLRLLQVLATTPPSPDDTHGYVVLGLEARDALDRAAKAYATMARGTKAGHGQDTLNLAVQTTYPEAVEDAAPEPPTWTFSVAYLGVENTMPCAWHPGEMPDGDDEDEGCPLVAGEQFTEWAAWGAELAKPQGLNNAKGGLSVALYKDGRVGAVGTDTVRFFSDRPSPTLAGKTPLPWWTGDLGARLPEVPRFAEDDARDWRRHPGVDHCLVGIPAGSAKFLASLAVAHHYGVSLLTRYVRPPQEDIAALTLDGTLPPVLNAYGHRVATPAVRLRMGVDLNLRLGGQLKDKTLVEWRSAWQTVVNPRLLVYAHDKGFEDPDEAPRTFCPDHNFVLGWVRSTLAGALGEPSDDWRHATFRLGLPEDVAEFANRVEAAGQLALSPRGPRCQLYTRLSGDVLCTAEVRDKDGASARPWTYYPEHVKLWAAPSIPMTDPEDLRRDLGPDEAVSVEREGVQPEYTRTILFNARYFAAALRAAVPAMGDGGGTALDLHLTSPIHPVLLCAVRPCGHYEVRHAIMPINC